MPMSDAANQSEANPFELTRDQINGLINDAHGCVVTWTRRDGHPAAAYVTHAILDGEIYITSRERRAKNVALRRDPRTAVVVEIPGRGGVTILGRAEFSEDPELRRRIMNAMADRANYQGAARENFIRNLDSPGRVIIRIVPERYASRNERTAPAAYGSAQGMPSNYR
jgi:PPOX class probable F420-dependent enzyme